MSLPWWCSKKQSTHFSSLILFPFTIRELSWVQPCGYSLIVVNTFIYTFKNTVIHAQTLTYTRTQPHPLRHSPRMNASLHLPLSNMDNLKGFHTHPFPPPPSRLLHIHVFILIYYFLSPTLHSLHSRYYFYARPIYRICCMKKYNFYAYVCRCMRVCECLLQHKWNWNCQFD